MGRCRRQRGFWGVPTPQAWAGFRQSLSRSESAGSGKSSNKGSIPNAVCSTLERNLVLQKDCVTLNQHLKLYHLHFEFAQKKNDGFCVLARFKTQA